MAAQVPARSVKYGGTLALLQGRYGSLSRERPGWCLALSQRALLQVFAALLKMAGVSVFAQVGWSVLDCRMTHPIRQGG